MIDTDAEDRKVTATRRSVLMEAANTLGDARRTKNPILSLPEELRPANETEAYVIQQELSSAFGEVGGWKVGAASPDASPTLAPMSRIWTAASGTEFRALRYRAVEAEVAFRLGADLPARSEAYTRDEVLRAVESCHPVIEILESAFDTPSKVDRLSALADMGLHGGFVYGPSFPNWRDIDFAQESVELAVDGIVRLERTGSNTYGDLVGLLPWLANEGSRQTGGLRAGQWITTGSWTGSLPVEVNSTVIVRFRQLGEVSVAFAPEQDLEKGLPGTTRRFS